MDVVIIGAGGHGKVVLDILRASNTFRPIAFLDADPSMINARVGNLPVLGNIHHIGKLKQQKLKHAIVAIGDNRTRVSYAKYLADEGIELINAIHPSASISPTAKIGRNVVVCAHAVVCTEATIGHSVILNTSSVVDHECEVREGSHVCPTVALAGRVRIGAGAFVGIGAKVIPCLSIGEHAIIGAGAVVTRDIPAGATAVGIPARVIKTAAIAA